MWPSLLISSPRPFCLRSASKALPQRLDSHGLHFDFSDREQLWGEQKDAADAFLLSHLPGVCELVVVPSYPTGTAPSPGRLSFSPT